MEIGMVGISQETASQALRERFSFTRADRVEALMTLSEQLEEVVLLTTCNRTEIYFAAEDAKAGLDSCQRFLLAWAGQKGEEEAGAAGSAESFADPSRSQAASALLSFTGHQAVQHLFLVAAGLDSAILGEDQILAQVKDALAFSLELKFSGKILNRLFMDAISAGKAVRSDLHISEIPLSSSYIGMQYLKRQVPDLTDQSILVIGAGEMARLAIRYLVEDHPKRLLVANRSRDRVQALQADFPSIRYVPYENRYQVLATVDILIAATKSPHLVVRAEKVERKAGAGRLTAIDLAMPKNIDPALGERGDVSLVDLEELEGQAQANSKKRQDLAREAQALLAPQADAFCAWLGHTAVDGTLALLEERMTSIQQDAMAFLDRKAPLEGRERKMVDKMLAYALHRLTRGMVLDLKADQALDPALRARISRWLSEGEG